MESRSGLSIQNLANPIAVFIMNIHAGYKQFYLFYLFNFFNFFNYESALG